MREVESIQVELGAPFIKDIQIDTRSRDDIPALLRGLQHIYTDQPTRTKVFELLNARVKPDIDRETGRPGMALWQILVLSVLKQGLGCDYDRLQELANQHRTVREMLGHGTLRYEYKLQTVIDNVSLLNAELLSEISPGWWCKAVMRWLEKSLAKPCAVAVTRFAWRLTCTTRRMYGCCGIRCDV